MNERKLEFEASLPAIQSAWKRHGGGDGVRIQLDIPEDQLRRVQELEFWVQRNIKFTAELLDS